MKEKRKFQHLTSKDVYRNYELLLETKLVSFILSQDSKNKVDSLIASISNIYFDNDPFPTPQEKAVAYFYLIIKDHPFVDGNKRTASLTFTTVCSINGLKPNLGLFPLDELAIYIESLREADHHKAIKVLSDKIFS